jgi:transposase
VPKLRPHLPTIRTLLAATPDVTLAELRDELRVTAALSTLWAAARSLGLTFKKVARATGQDRPDVRATRDAWRQETAPALDPNRAVLVDETGANTAMGRRYGYTPWGEPVVGAVPNGHYKSRTFTAALRADRVTATQVLDGPMAADRFREYVTTVLVPTLRPGAWWSWATSGATRRPGGRAAVEATGCELRFLPPYSPDWNPIELAFAKRKRGLRSDGYRAAPTLVNFLALARTAYRPEECAAYIPIAGTDNHLLRHHRLVTSDHR